MTLPKKIKMDTKQQANLWLGYKVLYCQVIQKAKTLTRKTNGTSYYRANILHVVKKIFNTTNKSS